MRLLSRIPVHPLLFAAYAVLFLYAANLALVLPVDAEAPLARAVAGAALVWAVCAVVLRDPRRGAVVATASVVAFFAYGHVTGGLSAAGLDDRAQLVLWGLALAAALVYAIRARGSLPSVTAGLNVFAIVLVVVSATSIVPYELGRAGRPSIDLAPPVRASATTRTTRDIYFLIFDRYGSAESIQRRFNITDNDLYDWLRGQGFQVPAHSHANYRATDFSLAATLNMRYLDDLTQTIGRISGDRTPAQAMFKDHAVGEFLKAEGYRYYQLGSWFGPTSSIPIADENLGLGITSEFESVLNDTTVLPAIDRVLGHTTPGLTFFERHREGTLFELRELQRLSTAPGPKFVFAHILLPHDPYVFRADGSYLTEAEAAAITDERSLYDGQLEFANTQIKAIVQNLLSGPEATRPIVIIEGDEGPLMCRSVDCVGTSANYLRIRLGNLIAMYLPGTDVKLPDTFSSVNTFRTVFRTYFGADLPALQDRSYTWPDNDHIYDFEDITDLLNDPAP
ncbi:MAG TPA: hypothetical protein VGM28_04505 [Candidatus Limnocylindrales bacterium]